MRVHETVIQISPQEFVGSRRPFTREVLFPTKGKFLGMQYRDGDYFFWHQVDNTGEVTHKTIVIVTSWEGVTEPDEPSEMKYLGSVLNSVGTLHAFVLELKEPTQEAEESSPEVEYSNPPCQLWTYTEATLSFVVAAFSPDDARDLLENRWRSLGLKLAYSDKNLRHLPTGGARVRTLGIGETPDVTYG